jgi:hypothetical protein
LRDFVASKIGEKINSRRHISKGEAVMVALGEQPDLKSAHLYFRFVSYWEA